MTLKNSKPATTQRLAEGRKLAMGVGAREFTGRGVGLKHKTRLEEGALCARVVRCGRVEL